MWVSSAEMRRLLRALADAESRAASAELRLDEERKANRRSERHWANMLLRAKQSFPEQPAEAPAPAPVRPATLEDAMDPGELAALMAAGTAMGVEPSEIRRMLAAERGIDL